MARAAKRIFAALAGAVAALIAVEAMFQLIAATPLWRIMPVPEVSLYGPDREAGYAHRAGASGIWMSENRSRVTISSLGLRDRERAVTSSGPRAVLIGNSMMEALQVDQIQTAAAVAERILGKDRSGAEVVNLGLAGATPAVEMARLVAFGDRLSPDVAVIVLPMADFLSPLIRDDSAFVAYAPDEAGPATLSHGFRDGRGFRFRSSRAGDATYRALDNSLTATLLNNRKNIGFFAEFRKSLAPSSSNRHRKEPGCDVQTLQGLENFWNANLPDETASVRDGFLRDLRQAQNRRPWRIIVLSNGIEAGCAALSERRERLISIIRQDIEATGALYADLNALLVRKVGLSAIPSLHGFGPSLGGGHLNVEGNRVYGEIIAGLIKDAFAASSSRP